eukprot:gene11293-12302_t
MLSTNIARRFILRSRSLRASLGTVAKNGKNPYEWQTANDGIERATTPPSSWYLEKDFLEKVEKQHTFRGWLNVGHTHALKKEGDYLAVTVVDQPIVVVKTKTGYNAFYNVCRHHAAQICDEGYGSIGSNPQTCRFTCPYHGWQYNIEGKLTKAIQMKGCEGFAAKDFGLLPLPLQIIGPWIYINFSPDHNANIQQDLPDLPEMTAMLDSTHYQDLVHYTSRSYTINCNWKVFIDNYLDGGYHVPVAHKDLSANLDLKQYERKSYQTFHLQTCPSSSASDNDTRVSGGNPGALAYYIYQYPNICINRYGQWLDTNIVWPTGPQQCVVQFDWFIHPSLLADRKAVDDSIEKSDKVQQEDVWLCERVQKGINSRGYDVGRYSPLYEGGEYLFHQKLYEDYKKSSLYKDQQ